MPLSKRDLTPTEMSIYNHQIERGVHPLVLLYTFEALRKRNIPPDVFPFDIIDPSLSEMEQMDQVRKELKKYGLTEEDIRKIDIESEEEKMKAEEEKYILSEFEKQAGLEPGLADAFADVLARRIIKKLMEEMEKPIKLPEVETKPPLEIARAKQALTAKQLLLGRDIAYAMYKEEREALNEQNAFMQARLAGIALDYARNLGIIFDPTPRERKGKVKAFDSFVNLRLRPEKEFMGIYVKEAYVPEYMYYEFLRIVPVSEDLYERVIKDYGVFNEFGYIERKKIPNSEEVAELTGNREFETIEIVKKGPEMIFLSNKLTLDDINIKIINEEKLIESAERANETYRGIKGKEYMLTDIPTLKIIIAVKLALLDFIKENYNKLNKIPRG
jgi:hypothetical protein